MNEHSELGLPMFDYPTPVNCSVRMKKKGEEKKNVVVKKKVPVGGSSDSEEVSLK